MKKLNIRLWLTALLLLLVSLLLSANKKGLFEKKVTSKDLGGAERYLLYASTDKPIYRANETLYLRVVALNAKDNTPLKNRNFSAFVKIRGPKGDILFNEQGGGQDSVAGVKWIIPPETPGGKYTAYVSSPHLGCPVTKRVFEIRAYRAPRLKSQIVFLRKGYGPGDTVKASIDVTRAEGGKPVNAKVTILARVDGVQVYKKAGFTIDKKGSCSVKFTLPDSISVGDGSLSFIIEDGGVVETASKTIPIVLQNMNISFYPEGGDLIAGLDSRVYVQALRPNGKPADIEGGVYILTNNKSLGKKVATLKTKHEGRGVFHFSPKEKAKYVLVLNKPSGINRKFHLPKVVSEGATLKSLQDIYPYDGSISFLINSTQKSQLAKITMHKREIELDSKVIVSGRAASVSLNPKDSEGILMVTLWNKEGNPLAERLVYRKPRYEVNVKISAGKEPFSPGGKVKLNIETTDESGKPIEAVVGITVTDDSVLEMIDKREQAPRLPVMVYLENDVKDLADAHVYLDHKNASAPMSLDLLLGTQGWRRFVLKRYSTLKKNFPAEARRVLAEKQPRRHIHKKFKEAKNRLQFELNGNKKEPENPLKNAVKVAAVKQKKPLQNKINNDLKANVKPVEAKALKVIAAKEENEMFLADEIVVKEMGDVKRHWVSVRVYAHKVRPNRRANDRVDFTETLYWNTGIRTGARDGKASIEFDLSDSITSFRVMADTFGRNGALGSSDLLITSVEPFYIEPKLPLEATVGDQIQIPVALVNASKNNIESVNLIVKGKGLVIKQTPSSSLAAGKRARRIINVSTNKPGSYTLKFSAAAGSFTDTVTRVLIVKSKGFPREINHGGLLGPNDRFFTEITIPKEIELGSLTAMAKIFPSPLANMEEALNALLRQPSGCFEQTSSTNYPLVMAQQYFTSHQGIPAKKIAKAQKLLDAGYKKLIGFECKKKGYEWFGGDPAHEALTAYGLMEFSDMAKIMPLDTAMMTRTRSWLLSRRDGKGGFKQNKRALDSFGRAPAPTTNAYIIWALLESGEKASNITKEIEAIKKEALKSNDSYVIALAANILYLTGDYPNASTLSQKLSEALKKNGLVGGAKTSITRSSGMSLNIETTSLAILAWLKDDNRWAAQVESSMKWLFESCQAGRFGSTQSTVLALKAINAYDAARAKPKQPGAVQLLIDDKPFGKPVSFNKDTKGAIELPDFSAALVGGKHTLALRMSNGAKMPFALEVKYNTNLPVSNKNCNLRLSTKLSTTKIKEGETMELNMTVQVGVKDAPTPIAIIGIPAGLEVRHDQLKELVGDKRIDSYEVKGREVILYWRALKANEKRNVPLSLTAAIPGSYEAPASRSYLYYTDEFKTWEKGQSIIILPR